MKRVRMVFGAMLLFAVALMVSRCGEPAAKMGALIEFDEPAREAGQSDVLGLKCDPMDTVRVAFIGIGNRGGGAVVRFTQLDGVKIVAICDIEQRRIDEVQGVLAKAGLPAAEAYCGSADAWKEVCERPDVDLVYVCTGWDLHTPIAVYAMEQGKHVALEVPAALTIDECWQLVNTSEKTRKHCMMLENCCYDFFEMATLNMAQQGLFGEIVHTEGAYIHDLRHLNFDESPHYQGMWRLEHNALHTGNPYPTHGLGPLCQILDIHRGDKMDYLVSVSTDQFGMTKAATDRFGAESSYAKREYKLGDMNTTIIRTAKGKTILLQHDVTSPRPYSRLHAVSGTKGFAQKYPVEGIALEPNAHAFLSADSLALLLAAYEHPLSKEIGAKAREVGGHGGMDYIMDYRLVYCLRNGLPLDQDVYDAAEWSSIVELSETSVLNNGAPVRIPDFTRGAWDKIKGFSLATK